MKSAIKHLLILCCLSNCTPTYDAARAIKIQNEEGFFTKSLHYGGSSEQSHYFAQNRLQVFPWQTGERMFKVPADQLTFPQEQYFLRTGDDRSTKVRLVGPPYTVEPRASASERFMAK
jgi:hypothetical protein